MSRQPRLRQSLGWQKQSRKGQNEQNGQGSKAALEMGTAQALGLVQTLLQDIGKDPESTLYVAQCVEIDEGLNAEAASDKLVVRVVEASPSKLSAASSV